MARYFVVGATWDKTEDKLPEFIDGGYWQMGWEDSKKPDMAAIRDSIRPGDRIAVKRILGPGNANILIRALGIVREVDKFGGRVYVDWILRGLSREVPSNACYGTIHGPYTMRTHPDWIPIVFRI